MDIWQYNAWCEAWQYRCSATLQQMVQAAYMNAYWTNSGKKGKSLSTVLKYLRVPENKPRKKIDVDTVAEQFRQFEELRKYGRVQVKRN